MRDFLRRVGLPSIIDATPATLRPPVHMTPAARLLLLVGRPLWAWRVELATLLLAVAGLRWLARPPRRPGQLQRPSAPSRQPPPHPGRGRPGGPGAGRQDRLRGRGQGRDDRR